MGKEEIKNPKFGPQSKLFVVVVIVRSTQEYDVIVVVIESSLTDGRTDGQTDKHTDLFSI